MNKIVMLGLTGLLSSCSLYQSVLTRMQTDTLTYQCGEQPLVIERNNRTQQIRLEAAGKTVTLNEGLSGIGQRYSDGVYAFWMNKPDHALLYRHDRLLLSACELTSSSD